jgi:hypothetical protein
MIDYGKSIITHNIRGDKGGGWKGEVTSEGASGWGSTLGTMGKGLNIRGKGNDGG